MSNLYSDHCTTTSTETNVRQVFTTPLTPTQSSAQSRPRMLSGGGGGGSGGGGLPPPPPPPNITNITTLKVDFRDKDRFAGQEYNVWAMHMQVIFEEHELWNIVYGTTPEPAAGHADLPQWTRSDKRARSLILQRLDQTMIHHTQAAPTSHGVWSKLSTLYQAADSAHKMIATHLFHTMTMKENDQVEKYVIQFRSARARLASCGTNLSETEAAKAFLASLHSTFKTPATLPCNPVPRLTECCHLIPFDPTTRRSTVQCIVFGIHVSRIQSHDIHKFALISPS